MRPRARRRPRPQRRVYFEDEAPSLGAGWRGVDVVSVGRKWVRLRSPFTGRRARLPRPVWDRLVAAALAEAETPR